ncbi:hypothetical protein G8764_05350 [Pseudomaricurvus alcaniphilus]|uniref:pectate lyase family protein n=1 Tax=Pseudomaricurvus alcaniphilus TaxID=1166482 RepID=UPI00140C61BD|nr:hypothetical protein [Pseudomaricurvus alcaniphilus]NHN36715.1 hypothetical protein [Pseudomaricurvus alcaniphilus]
MAKTVRLPVSLAFIVFYFLSFLSTASALPAFKGAEGFGSDNTHARGREVCRVTRLDDLDLGQRVRYLQPGQFRYCLAKAAEEGGAYIIFDVSGIISLKRKAVVPSNVYIAGQTSTGGIAVSGNSIEVDSAQNVVIRHLRHREAAHKGDAFNIKKSSNIILDHVSVSFFRDGAVDIIDNSHDITVQWSHMGDAIRSGSKKEPYHGQPNLLRTGVDRISLHHNYYTHIHSRTPLVQYTCKPGMLIEFSNNLIYNFRKYPSRFDAPNGRGNAVGNYYIPGVNTHGDSPTGLRPVMTGRNNFSLFVQDNIVESGKGHDASAMPGRGQDIWRGPPASSTGSRTQDSDAEELIMGLGQGQLGPTEGQFNQLRHRVAEIPEITLYPVRESAALVLQRFGALPRDRTDWRLVEELNQRTGEWKFVKPDDQNVYIGEPLQDSDQDGMSDAFEGQYGGDLQPHDHDLDPLYENIEVYLDSLAAQLLQHAKPVTIELAVPKAPEKSCIFGFCL